MVMKLVDPFNFTKFDRTDAELEAMLIFCIMFANKRADQSYTKFETFMPPGWRSPFHFIHFLIFAGHLENRLRLCKIGQYKRIEQALVGIMNLKNLRICTVADLEKVHGIGPKTARMFLLHSRPNQRVAVLDTHVLAHLRDCGVKDVPRNTPPKGKNYERLELEFLAYADAMAMTPAEFDADIWARRTKSRITTDFDRQQP